MQKKNTEMLGTIFDSRYGAVFFLYLQGCLVNARLFNEHEANHQVNGENDIDNIHPHKFSSVKNGTNEGLHEWNNGSYVKLLPEFN